MEVAPRKQSLTLGFVLVAAGACLVVLPQKRVWAQEHQLVPVVWQESEQPAAQPEDQQVPVLPETVVPGQQPGEAPPSSALPPGGAGGQGGALSRNPFSSSGAFGNRVDGPFLPDVQGTRTNAGKKTRNIEIQERPAIIDNNYRQALIKVPSLLLSEESTPLVAIGYRGLNPDRNSFMQVLEDGIPIAANIFGFNESYYLPPFQVVDHIEFIHGGSALLYGPQPGGALNFVTKNPLTDRAFSFTAENVFGSHNFFSTYESGNGTVGSLGYYIYGLHRESDGFRDFNGGYDLDYGGIKVIIDLTPCARLIGVFNAYDEEHGEPGRLTRADFEADPDQANRPFDYFELERNFVSLAYQQVLDDRTLWELKIWGNDFDRFSRRQTGGGFGTAPTGDQSDLRFEEFKVFGIEPRLRHDYDLFGTGDLSTLTAGVLYYYNNGLRHDTRGPVQARGKIGPEPRIITDRDTDYFSFFAENRFNLGCLSVVPAVRLENIRQDVAESFNIDKANAGEPLGRHNDSDFVPLVGMGIVYEWCPNVASYGNVSQAYRPKVFQETVAPGVGDTVAGDLSPGDSWQAEVGFRANPTPYFAMDTSLFYLRFKDQTGRVGSVIQNVGDSVHQGWDFWCDLDLIGLYDTIYGTNWVSEVGSLELFYNNMILDAEFTSGPAKGKAPQYAPDHVIRGGITYTYHGCSCNCGCCGDGLGVGPYGSQEPLRIWLTSTFVGRHFGDDANTPDFFVPSYKVWDLTGEWSICDGVAVVGGIYNLFDERYFGRVLGSGIEPQDGRNYFLGCRIIF